MNFLLHRHLAQRDTGSPLAGIGAMLPDLWRMADRRVRPRGARSDPEADPGTREVLDGIAHHLEVDRWFHRAPVFRDGERRAAELVRAAGVQAPRSPLLAHVTWEMALDGALIAAEGLETVLVALRTGFEAARQAIERAADLHHFGDGAARAADRAAFAARMSRLVTEITRGPWIDGYQDGGGLAVRVAGVRARLGLPPPDGDDVVRLADALDHLAEGARRALPELLDGCRREPHPQAI